jgi:hypothetical protein
MYELKMLISPADLIALGFCTMAGLERAEQMGDMKMKQAIEALALKLMNADKPLVPEQ